MSELAWHAVRNDTIRKFNGQAPRPQDEQICIDVFSVLPQLVLTAIDETAELVQGGKVRYGWSFLAARLVRGATPAGDVTVDTGSQRTKKIAAAERWLHNAGLYYDLERDIDDELFNERTGMLKDYAADQALRERLIKRWQDTERPRGERAEAETLAYQTGGDLGYRRLQWHQARAQHETWAMRDETFDAYEAERKAGSRPFWRGSGPPATATWPKPAQPEPEPVEADHADDYGPPELVQKEHAA